MKKDEKLLHQILHSLSAGIEFSDYMYFSCEEPGFNVISAELKAAHEWISRIIEQKEPKWPDKKQELFKLLQRCADMTEDNGYDFLAGKFERLASSIAPLPETQFGSIEEEAIAVH